MWLTNVFDPRKPRKLFEMYYRDIFKDMEFSRTEEYLKDKIIGPPQAGENVYTSEDVSVEALEKKGIVGIYTYNESSISDIIKQKIKLEN